MLNFTSWKCCAQLPGWLPAVQYDHTLEQNSMTVIILSTAACALINHMDEHVGPYRQYQPPCSNTRIAHQSCGTCMKNSHESACTANHQLLLGMVAFERSCEHAGHGNMLCCIMIMIIMRNRNKCVSCKALPQDSARMSPRPPAFPPACMQHGL